MFPIQATTDNGTTKALRSLLVDGDSEDILRRPENYVVRASGVIREQLPKKQAGAEYGTAAYLGRGVGPLDARATKTPIATSATSLEDGMPPSQLSGYRWRPKALLAYREWDANLALD